MSEYENEHPFKLKAFEVGLTSLFGLGTSLFFWFLNKKVEEKKAECLETRMVKELDCMESEFGAGWEDDDDCLRIFIKRVRS